MGTRSNYRVIEKYRTDDGGIKTRKHVNIYVQYDGYPEGHPLEIAKWLASGKVVNGLKYGENTLVFNGAGCLAAQLVKKLKDEAGNTYIHPIDDFGKCGEDYMYDIIVDFNSKDIEIIAYENHTRNKLKTITIFKGTPEEFVVKYGA